MYADKDVEWFINYITESTQHNYSRQLMEQDISKKLNELYDSYYDSIRESIIDEVKDEIRWKIDTLDI